MPQDGRNDTPRGNSLRETVLPVLGRYKRSGGAMDGEQRMRNGEILCLFFGGPLDRQGIWMDRPPWAIVTPVWRKEQYFRPPEDSAYTRPQERHYNGHEWRFGDIEPGYTFGIVVRVYLVANPASDEPKEATPEQVFGRAVEFGALSLRRIRYMGIPIRGEG